jgi:hypothetical protein
MKRRRVKMRCYQHIGLKQEAVKWLEKNVLVAPKEFCPNCNHVISTQMCSIVYETPELFYDDGPALNQYELADGGIVREIVQLAPWSSGPMGFLCLERENGDRLFQWTGKEVNDVENGLCEDTDEIA